MITSANIAKAGLGCLLFMVLIFGNKVMSQKVQVFVAVSVGITLILAVLLPFPLFIEGISVGVSFLILSSLAMYLQRKILPDSDDSLPFDKIKYYVTTFVVSMGIHFLFELFLVNKWYCENSFACLNLKNKKV